MADEQPAVEVSQSEEPAPTEMPAGEDLGVLLRERMALPIDDEDVARWEREVESGRVSREDVVVWAREQAAGLYQNFGDAIRRGVDPSLLLGPYRGLLREELGVEEVSRPLLLDLIAGDGVPALEEFRRRVRETPEWEESPRAREIVEGLMRGLGGRL